MPAVSIILLSRNRSGFLRDAIDSVLAQTFREWELIVVERGSTDGSATIADGYAAADSRIRVRHEPGTTALGQCIERAISTVAADLICFSWPAVCFAPNRLQRQMDTLAAAGREAAACYSPALRRNIGTGAERIEGDFAASGRILGTLLDACPDAMIRASTLLVRRRLLTTDLVYDGRDAIGPLLAIRIAATHPLVYSSDASVMVRDDDYSGANELQADAEGLARDLDTLSGQASFPAASLMQLRRAIVRCLRRAGEQSARADDVADARGMLIESLSRDPKMALRSDTWEALGLSLTPKRLRKQAARIIAHRDRRR